MARKATVEEIETKWGLQWLMKVHEAMDIEEEMQEYISKVQASRMKNK